MTDPTDDPETGIDRRTVLKSAAAASVAGFVGVPAFSGSGAAQTSALPYRFYTVHPFNKIEKLVGFDPIADGSGTVSATNVADLTYEGNKPAFGCYTIAFHPNGDLYGISAESTSRLFKIDTDTGEITIVDTVDTTTGASAFSYDGDTPYLYYLKPSDDKLARIKPDGSDQTEFDLTLDASFNNTTSANKVWEGESVSDYYGDYNSGLAVDFESKDLFAVIASVEDPPKPNGDDDKVQIAKDGTVSLLQRDVITENRKVGDEIDPCTRTITAIRAGDDLYELKESDTKATKIGDVKLGDSELDVASLASPWQIDDCGGVCSTDLIAGKQTTVGSVNISLDVDNTTTPPTDYVEVQYQTDDNWYLAETHLEVVDDEDNFPTAGRNNPKVGQFSYGDTYGPGVQSDSFQVDVSDLKAPYYVAAHAVVYHVDCGTEGESSFWATEIDAELGKTNGGDEIRDKYDDADAVLGEPADEHDLDGDAFLSLGFGGSAIVGFESPVYNPDGDRDIFVYETTGSSSSSWNNYPEETATIYVKEVGSDEWVEAGEVSNKDTINGWDGLGTVGIPSDIIAVEEVKIVDTTDASIHGDNANGYDLNAVGADCIQDQEETAWGDGCEFTDKGSWAMYTEYDSEDDICGCGDDGNGRQA